MHGRLFAAALLSFWWVGPRAARRFTAFALLFFCHNAGENRKHVLRRRNCTPYGRARAALPRCSLAPSAAGPGVHGRLFCFDAAADAPSAAAAAGLPCCLYGTLPACSAGAHAARPTVLHFYSCFTYAVRCRATTVAADLRARNLRRMGLRNGRGRRAPFVAIRLAAVRTAV